jgi:hypothetical protein
MLTAYTDGAPGGNPTTVRGAAAAHEYSGTNKQGRYASLLMPVRCGDYANVTYDKWVRPITPPDPNREAMFFSLGPKEDGAYLGDWATPSPVQLGEPFTAPGDGFLACAIRIPITTDGPFGNLRLFHGTDNQQPLAGSGVHLWRQTMKDCWYSGGSFCVPVPAGTTVTALMESTDENRQWGDTATDFEITTDWLPLQGGLAFDRQRQGARMAGTQYTAETDGFLVASLGAPHGGHAYLTVDVTPATSDGSALPSRTLGRTSVHRRLNSANDEINFLIYNTVTVPIRAGSTYTVNVDQHTPDSNGNDVERYLTWTPLITH